MVETLNKLKRIGSLAAFVASVLMQKVDQDMKYRDISVSRNGMKPRSQRQRRRDNKRRGVFPRE